jgi:hypothetical protein
MTPESVARRFEQRPGYDLIDYAPVVLPLHRLTIDAITLVHRPIPPIKEFVMRGIAAGLVTSTEISGFLGLDDASVQGAISQLLEEKYAEAEREDRLRLTDRGREVLQAARESAPQDEMLVLLYDRLLLKPVRLGPEQLLAPADVDHQRTIEIRPYPAEGPSLQELTLPDVRQVLETDAGGRSKFGRDLLRLKRIARRMRVYRPAVALVYKKNRSSEIQIAFIVDDARHEGLEHAFAARGGPKKMGFVRAIDESTTVSELRRYLGADVLDLLPDAEELDERRVAVSMARLRYQTAVNRAERSGGALEASAAIDETALALARAENELANFPARAIAPYEHAELMAVALERCEKRLLISSRTLQRSVMDGPFIRRLRALLALGARVTISVVEVGNEGAALGAELERMRKQYPDLELVTSRRSRFYHVVCDSRMAVVSNQPFLSNLSKNRSFHHVAGYVLQRPDLVDAFCARIEQGRDPKS